MKSILTDPIAIICRTFSLAIKLSSEYQLNRLLFLCSTNWKLNFIYNVERIWGRFHHFWLEFFYLFFHSRLNCVFMKCLWRRVSCLCWCYVNASSIRYKNWLITEINWIFNAKHNFGQTGYRYQKKRVSYFKETGRMFGVWPKSWSLLMTITNITVLFTFIGTEMVYHREEITKKTLERLKKSIKRFRMDSSELRLLCKQIDIEWICG